MMCDTRPKIKITIFCSHIVFMCLVWISKQTAIICLCVLYGSENKQRLFMCLVWISNQTAIIYVSCMDIKPNSDVLCVLYGYQNKQRLFMCLVWISNQTAIIYVSCMDIKPNSDYFPLQHQLIDQCLQPRLNVFTVRYELVL